MIWSYAVPNWMPRASLSGLLVLGLSLAPCAVATAQPGRSRDAIRAVTDSTPTAPTLSGTRTVIHDSVLTPCPDTIRHVVTHHVRPHPTLRTPPAVRQVRRVPRPRVHRPRVHRPRVLAHLNKRPAQRRRPAPPACERIEIREKLCTKPGALTVAVLPDKMVPPAPHPTIEPTLAPDVFAPPSPVFPTMHADRLFRPQMLGLAAIPVIFWIAMHEGGGKEHTVQPPPGPDEPPVTTIPEPGVPLLLGTGLAFLLLVVWRRRGADSPLDRSLLR